MREGLAQSRLSAVARGYAWAVVAGGAFAGARLAQGSVPGSWHAAPLLFFGTLCVVAATLSVTYRGFLPSAISHQIGTSFAYALFFLASPVEVAMVLLLATAADWALHRRRPLTAAFNAGQLMLALWAAVGMREILRPGFVVLDRVDGATMTAAVLSLSAFFLVNHGLTRIVIGLANRQPVLRLDAGFRIGILNETFCVVSGLGMAVLWWIRPALSLLGIVPIFLMVVLLQLLSRRERELELRQAELGPLQDLGFEIGAELDAQRLEGAVVRVATEALRSTGALLGVLEEDRRRVRVLAHRGLLGVPPATIALAGLDLAFFEAGRILRIEDLPSRLENYPEFRFLGSVGALCAPVRIGGRREGLLLLFHDCLRRPFDEEDVRRLETLMRFVEMALSNARLVADLKAVQARLLESEKLSALGMLVSGVAHELNNPLTSVIGYAQLLLEKDPDADRKRMLGRVDSEASRARRIVQNLLTFARNHKTEKKPTDINAVLDQVLDLRAYELRVENIELVRRLSPGLSLVLADPHQIHQVLLNLLTNAEHAVRAVPRRGRITVETTEREGRVRLAVTDNGQGIAAENLGKLFVPFFTTKEVGQGTGLGLSICYGIVREHGGRIHVESREGEGASFVVELPAVVSAARAAEEPLRDEVAVPAPSGSGHVLVVDDEEPIAELVRDILETRGWRVSAARDGAEALRLVADEPFDVLLVDIKMPGMDGRAFYTALRESQPELARRIVFSTGDAASDGTTRFLEGAGNSVLAKPYDVASLLTAVSRVAEQAHVH